MKVFLDVGAHLGQSVRSVLGPEFGFERIDCFEPAPDCWPQIEAFADPRVRLHRFGLWNADSELTLHGSGGEGASIFGDAEGVDGRRTVTHISVRQASTWISRNVQDGDVVFMKMNCEGSECDILDDLIDHGQLERLYSVMVDFDVRKVPSQRHREPQMIARLRRLGIRNVCFSREVMVGPTHEDRIRNWLRIFGAGDAIPLADLRRKYESRFRAFSPAAGPMIRSIRFLVRLGVARVLPRGLKERIRQRLVKIRSS